MDLWSYLVIMKMKMITYIREKSVLECSQSKVPCVFSTKASQKYVV